MSVAKTIRIPPKHNGAISVSIKGHDIKTCTACFIGSQYTDTEVRLIDGVHDISRNATLQVLVINNSNQHMNFPKGMKIGHLEPPIDDLAQIPINSATTQWMLPETIKPDSCTPPKYQLDATTQQQLDFLLRTFRDQFTKDETTIGTTPLTHMSIDTGDSDPISQKPYPVAMKHYQWVKEEIDKLLEAGVIRNSHSSWSAPIIVVPKGDGGKHLVIDYRALNKVTRKFVWPMPKVEDIFSQLNSAKYFSTLDLRAGYQHIGLTTDSIPKMAFTSPFGKYEYIQGTFRTSTSTGLLPRIDDRSSGRSTICYGLSGRHHHIQLYPRRTLRTHQDSHRETLPCQTINETEQVPFLRQGNTISRTHPRHGRDQTSPSQDRSHQGYAPTSEPKTGSRLPRTSGLLQKIHQELR